MKSVVSTCHRNHNGMLEPFKRSDHGIKNTEGERVARLATTAWTDAS